MAAWARIRSGKRWYTGPISISDAEHTEAALNVGVAPLADRASRVLYSWYLRRQSPRWQSRDQVRLEYVVRGNAIRRLKAGRYRVEVAPGTKGTQLAPATSRGFVLVR